VARREGHVHGGGGGKSGLARSGRAGLGHNDLPAHGRSYRQRQDRVPSARLWPHARAQLAVFHRFRQPIPGDCPVTMDFRESWGIRTGGRPCRARYATAMTQINSLHDGAATLSWVLARRSMVTNVSLLETCGGTAWRRRHHFTHFRYWTPIYSIL